jgi:hypothetical protein
MKAAAAKKLAIVEGKIGGTQSPDHPSIMVK